MPKNPLKFARRKSSGNVLDEEQPTPTATSSFRVLERPEKINLNGDHNSSTDRLRQVQRPFASPLAQLKGRSVEELSAGVNRLVDYEKTVLHENVMLNGVRGSGGTTNSGSSGYNESSSASARHSSSSTLPSSIDAEREAANEELFARKPHTTPMYQDVAADASAPLPAPPSFTTRAARALSWGQKHNRNGSGAINAPPPIPPVPDIPARSHSPPQRDRAMTASSYASTAVPSKPNLDLNLGSSDFGSDFSSMFDKGDKDLPPPPPPKSAYHRTESEPMFPPRTLSRQAFRQSPDDLKNIRDAAGSPYSLESRSSNEHLMSGSAMSSPRLNDDGPPVPQHGSGLTGLTPAFLGNSKGGYALVSDRTSPGLERSSQDSQGFSANGGQDRRGSYDTTPSEDEDSNAVKRIPLHDAQDVDCYSSESDRERSRSATVTRKPLAEPSNSPLVARKPLGTPSQAVAGASRNGAMSPSDSEHGSSLWESSTSTPRAAKATLGVVRDDSDRLFDTSPQGPPSRAIIPQHMRTESGTPMKLTKAQFERLQRGEPSSSNQSDDDNSSVDEFDDEDDAERAKRVARQRQKQEANMAVYRQQMKKVTGGGPTDLPSAARPSLDRAAVSAPASGGGIFHLGGIGGQPPEQTMRGKEMGDDDEDVPLGILQAHGFPSANRPPTRQGDAEISHQRRASGTGSVVGGGAGQGNLPPFARRLPADPYFGASVVNPAHRESMGMSSAASVYGGAPMMPGQQQPLMPMQQPQMGHPGGLVGIIAGEERAKAARRGSPNPVTGAFTGGGQTPNMGPMPNMFGSGGRSMTMSGAFPPQTYTPSGLGPVPPMPMMPGMAGIPSMPSMPMMPTMPMQVNPQQEQMKQFMQMQMQVMQNMLAMQQQQMGQTPPPLPQQPQDYLGIPNIAGSNPRHSVMSQQSQAAPSIRSQAPPNQGRAMTMMNLNPPARWDISPGSTRPNSSAILNTYAPSSMNIGAPGPGPGYTPSIAPSERSNVGMPSRYRPVTSGGNNENAGRSQTMTSTFTNAWNQKRSSTMPAPPQQQKSTIKIVEKPKGAPRISSRVVQGDDEDEEGWADLAKKREKKKKFGWGKSSKKAEAESPVVVGLEEMY